MNVRIINSGAHSSAGSEHLPYKQGVQGSNPCGPTKVTQKWVTFFIFIHALSLLHIILRLKG
jgi:hypothetical protein